MKRTRRVIALAVAVLMLTASVEAGAVVLCFGSDGHVAVEVADAWQRCVDLPHHESSEASRWTTDDSCGPCEDVELLVPSATLAGLSKKAATPPLIMVEPVFSEPLARASTIAPTVPSDSPVTVSLRTIVLLV